MYTHTDPRTHLFGFDGFVPRHCSCLFGPGRRHAVVGALGFKGVDLQPQAPQTLSSLLQVLLLPGRLRLNLQGNTQVPNMNWKLRKGAVATERTGSKLHLRQPRLCVSNVGPGPGDGLLGRCLGAPGVHQGLFDRLSGGLHSLSVMPGSLGVQQQLLCLADVILGALQDGVHIGEAANALLDLVGQVPDLNRRGGD